MSTDTLISIFGPLLATLLTIAGIIGTWAALRVGKNAQTLKNFRDSADSWKEKSQAQEVEITDLRKENSQLKSEIAELRGKVSTLGDLVATAISELASPSNSQHKEVLERLDSIANKLGGSK